MLRLIEAHRHLGVSIDGASPKWMGKMMENPIKNGIFWGTPIFMETPGILERYERVLQAPWRHVFCGLGGDVDVNVMLLNGDARGNLAENHGTSWDFIGKSMSQ